MKLKIIKKFASNFTIALLAYRFCVQPVNASNSYSVSYTRYPQEKTKWCWVASAECSGKHLVHSSRTQTDAVTLIKGGNYNVTGTLDDIVTAAEYFTINQYNYIGVDRKYPYPMFKAQLMKKCIPIACAGYYDGTKRTGGHATPVHLLYQGNSGEIILGYYDPQMKQDYFCPYEKFCDGTYNGRIYDKSCFVE